MKVTVVLKLLPSSEQAQSLKETLERVNEACNQIASCGLQHRVFGQFPLHRLCYHEIRATSGLAAQVVVQAIAKVADAFKGNRGRRRTFRPHGSIAYDDRLLRYKSDECISIWSVHGRLVVPFVCGERQREQLANQRGEARLVFWEGTFYLHVVCEIDVLPPQARQDVLGVDLGIVNLAVDSNGQVYSGREVEEKRRRYSHRRRNLQRKKTRSATRKLRALRGRQARYQRDVNHYISKAIVAVAQRTGCAIALEDLGGMRGRVTARRRQRARLANWGYMQLRSFIEYKARRVGIQVILVDPRNTSRTCPECGCVDPRNRRSQSDFHCTRCGHSALADWCAARIIRARAVVSRPMVAAGTAGTVLTSASYKPAGPLR